MSTTEKAVETENYDELGVSELAKKVNDAYYQIYSHDRADYPRAVMVGEMLNNLKPRVTKHGGWQKWLKENCPKISYETANIYMRISDPDNQKKIIAKAAAKNVAATDLTIAFAREALKTPKAVTGTGNTGTDTSAGSSDDASTDDAKADDSDEPIGSESDADTGSDGDDDDVYDEDGGGPNVNQVFNKLTTIYADDKESLKALTKKLCEHLGLKVWEPLPPRPTGQAEGMNRSH